MHEDNLDQRLRKLPKAFEPPADGWDVISRRLHDRKPALPAGMMAAAAVAIFLAGAASGLLLRQSRKPASAAFTNEPLAVAAEVQRTGSEYVVALASLRQTRLPRFETMQGYEAAINSLDAAMHELANGGVIPAQDSSVLVQVKHIHRRATEAVDSLAPEAAK